ncbi:MAG: hypothetical protein NTZ13_00005, partial [Candidatus Parcubacteria bacterium]|nr:hypothetical protein [Candidatus Parcubacteria bacterium]
MRSFISFFFTLLSVAIGFGITNMKVIEAKNIGTNVPWNTVISSNLAYCYNQGSGQDCFGWALGLSNINVTISRNALAYKNGVAITDNSNVSVGDVISFGAIVADSDIYWFGVGYSDDSPYGHWVADSAAPSNIDISNDFVGVVRGASSPGELNVYVPLSVSPSSITYTHTGSTAELDCDGDGKTDGVPVGSSCKVMSPGIVYTQVNYSATSGKFYYAYSGGSFGLAYNKVAMSDGLKGKCFTTYGAGPQCFDTDSYLVTAGIENWVEPDPYLLSVPAQQIDFTLTALAPVPANNKPTIDFTKNLNNDYLVNNNQSFT